MKSSCHRGIAAVSLAALLLAGCGEGQSSSTGPKRSGAGPKSGAEKVFPNLGEKSASDLAKRARVPKVRPVAPSAEHLEKAVFVSVQDPGIDENVNLFLFGEDGKPLCPITEDGIQKEDVALSPDGERIAFILKPRVRPKRSDVIVMDLETGQARNLTQDFPPQIDIVRQLESGGGADLYRTASPSFTRDGRVVFASGPLNGVLHLYAVPATGGEIEQLTLEGDPKNRTTRFFEPHVSPVANQAVFARMVKGDRGVRRLWVVDLDTGEERPVTQNEEGTYRSPRWSPDGTWIAFLADDPGNPRHRHLYRVRPDGSAEERLTDEPVPSDEVQLSWHPDGRSIAFIYRLGLDASAENNEVYLLDVETRETRRVSHTPMFERSPVFFP